MRKAGGADWPDRLGWLALGLLVAAYAWPQREAADWTVKLAVLGAGSLGLMAGGAWIARGRRVGNGLAVAAAALATWLAAGVGWSIDPSRTAVQALLAGSVLTAAAFRSVRIRPVQLATVIVGLAGLEAAAGSFQWFGTETGNVFRSCGTFVNANHHAALLAAGLATAGTWAVCGRGGFRAAAGITALWLAFVGALAGSRMFPVATAAGFAALAVAKPRGFRWTAWWIAAAGTAAVLVLSPGLRSRVARQWGGFEPFAFSRGGLWVATLKAVRAEPVVGYGLGGFEDAYPAVRQAAFTGYAPRYPHSAWLHLLSEAGVVGFGLALWVVTCAARVARRSLARPGGGAVVAATVACGMYTLSDFPLHVPALAGLLAAGGAALVARGREPATPGSKRVIPALGTVGVTILAAAWVAGSAASELAYQAGARAFALGRQAEARERFDEAAALNRAHAGAWIGLAAVDPLDVRAAGYIERARALRPRWKEPRWAAFDRARNRGDRAAMGRELEASSRFDPHGLETSLMRVYVLAEQGRWREARTALDPLEVRWPHHVDVRLARAAVAEGAGRPEEARRILEALLRRHPAHRLARAGLERLRR